ncbi:MAG: PrsW family intramembrane metalloprotease, partial [Candidatus Nealsonbacteria bacterium]|nr:PrsW family intramembrane metalloprotease [Candidatus Nealsonbacteria bacterium]
TIGYFLSFSFYKEEKRTKFVALGLLIAAILHGFYNFFIMRGEGNLRIFGPLAILTGLAIFVAFGIKKLQRISKIAKI